MRTNKRFLSLLLALCLTALLCVPALAAGFPVKKLAAPDQMQFLFSYPNEGSQCIEAIYTVPDDFCAVASLSTEDQQKYYNSAYETCIQFDWSVDKKDAFHYDETWDTIEGECPLQKVHGSFVEKNEAFWFTYDVDAERCAPGVVSKTTQTESEDGETETVTVRSFDFNKHKLYVRARFFVYEYATKTVITSPWSETVSVGDSLKNTAAPKVSQRIEAPTISKARVDAEMTGNFLFDIAFPEDVKKTAYDLKIYGTELNLESQIRVGDGEWTYWIVSDDLYPYLVGTRQFSLMPGDLENKIQYRCRLFGGNPDDGTAVTSAWSKLFTYENGKVELLENDDPYDDIANAEAEKLAQKEANKCGVCGVCPFHPFGVCMFIWIGIILVIALIVVYNIRASKKKKIREAEIKAREAASRSTSEDKTASIFNTDALTPKPNQKEEDQ